MKVGARVEVAGKNVQGAVAFVGVTHFSSGKWIGVILDDPKGKNSGTVQGKSYFQCKDNHGIFVRQSQLVALDDGQDGGGGGEVAPSPSASSGTPSTPGTTPGSTPATTPGSEEKKAHRSSMSRLPTSESSASPPSSDEKKTYRSSMSRLPTSDSSPLTQSVEEKKALRSSMSKLPTSDSTVSKEDDKNKGAKTPTNSTGPSKRASFIETNFVETVSYSSTVGGLEERMASLQQQQEIDTLRLEVKDLQEKLETLRGKRLQDKDKLKEMEKMRIQLQQLLEFKSKIMESQSELQRELQKARQEAKDAIEAREIHAEEMADLTEAAEMAALDKEMAEEKCETVQAEMEQLKERNEELTLDLEILKSEISDKGKDGAVTNYQTKQLEQQNERLKEALVKLRDLSAHDKQEQQRNQKEIDRQKSDITELSRTKEKLSAQIEIYEKQMADLKEQVDAALGAEEMVEQLTERNLNLEEKITELQETVSDLEALHDMNEELQENARETELELREEVDMANSRVREFKQKLEASHESLADLEQTIQKFRTLTETIKEHNQDLVQQLEKATNRAIVPQTDLYDFKIKFAETRAHTKAVEMELRRIEVQQANQHINYLRAFMPDEFLNVGGDHDAVLILLLIPRIVWKAEILIGQIREKYSPPESITKEAVMKNHAVEQYSFATHLIFLLLSLQSILHQYISALNSCTVELFLKLGMLYPEMAVQEKSLDFYIESLKKDQLDENILIEPLEKCLAYFHHLYGLHLNGQRVDCTVLMTDHTKLVLTACDTTATELGRAKVLLKPGQESGEIGLLCKEMETYTEEVRQMAKKIRRRLPQEGGPNPISFEKEVQAQLMDCNFHIGRVVRTLRELGQAAVQQALVTEAESGLTDQKMQELAHQASDKVYGKEDSGPVDCLKTSMSTVIANMIKVSSRVQDGEFDFDGTPEPLRQPPIHLRAQSIKAELKDLENLKLKLESREVDLLEAKKNMKLKLEELSELAVRKDMIEKRLEVASKEYEQKHNDISRRLEDTQLLLKKKEKEFEVTMDHLQADIDTLENEKSELKEKLKSVSKKALFENLTKTTALSSLSSPTSPTVPSHTGGSVSHRDSPLLSQQVLDLRLALQHVKDENCRLQARLLKNQLASLPILKVPQKPTGLKSPTGFVKMVGNEVQDESSQLAGLSRKTSDLLKELKTLSVTASVVDISKRKPASMPALSKTAPAHHLIEQAATTAQLQQRADQLQIEVTNFLATNRAGGKVHTDFSAFPTPQFTKALTETQQGLQWIGRVTIPQPPGSGSSVVPVIMNADGFRQLHTLLSVH